VCDGGPMIRLTRLNHVPLIVNADLIEHVEATPDTVVALTNGQKFMVLESAEEVVEKVIQFRRALLSSTRCPLKTTTDDSPEHAAADHTPAASWSK
jgi:flagellar protein FlbD